MSTRGVSRQRWSLDAWSDFREHLRWFDARPGRRVLVTRPREQAADLVDRLAALGADTVEAPVIRIAPPEDRGPLLQAATTPDAYDWIVFTSVNAIDAFMKALYEGGRDIRALNGPRLCTVGPGTAERLAEYRVRVELIPDEPAPKGLSKRWQKKRAPGHARAAAARGHRARGDCRRAAARGRRASMSLRIEPWPKSRCRTIPTYACCSKAASMWSRSRAHPRCALCADLWHGSVRGPAQEHGRGCHRTVDGGGGAPARYRSDGSAIDLYDSSARRRDRRALRRSTLGARSAGDTANRRHSLSDIKGRPVAFGVARSGHMAVKTASRLILARRPGGCGGPKRSAVWCAKRT